VRPDFAEVLDVGQTADFFGGTFFISAAKGFTW
jgi:hypothetical protein